MQDRVSVALAQQWVDAQPVKCGCETISIDSASDRLLFADITSEVDVPRFRRAMMDGFAVSAAQTAGASSQSPVMLEVIGEQMPGQQLDNAAARQAFDGAKAIHITTGAAMPEGFDSVVPVEFTQLIGNMVACETTTSPGKHVGQVGEDIRAGELVYRAGQLLRPQDIGIIASIGIDSVDVMRRPTVNIIVTGNELVPAGTKVVGNRIVDSNGPMLKSIVERDCGVPIMSGIIPDDPQKIFEAMDRDADMVLVVGGSSAGHEDFAPHIVQQHGQLVHHGVAMRPSSPTGMGYFKDKLVFLIPGNPVSCLCAYDFFAGRKIRQLSRGNPSWPYRQCRGILKQKLVSAIGRTDYARVRFDGEMIYPMAIGGASVLTTVSKSDGFVVIEAQCEGFPAGKEISLFLYG
jgi:molybdopterin molybdotransferase